MQAEPLQKLIDRLGRDISLADGTALRLRPILPGDKQAIARGLQALSSESRYLRFMSPMEQLSDKRLRYLTEIDYDRHFAWAAFALDEPGAPGVAVARYVRDDDTPTVAEPAVAVVDAYQGRGLGSLLLDLLAQTAAERGITCFRASLLVENQAMYRVLEQAGARFERSGGGVLIAEFALPPSDVSRLRLLTDMIRHACDAGINRARDVIAGTVARGLPGG